jgi:hypothetical protein
MKRREATKGHKGSTIYKSRSCDLGPEHVVRVRNWSKAGSRQGRGWAELGPD